MSNVKRVSDMDKFYDRIELDFGDDPPQSEFELKRRMQMFGYRVKKDKETGKKYKASPTQKQIDLAWQYIRKHYAKQKEIVQYPYSTFKDKYGYKRYRAIKANYQNGKLYRKGQFMPKQ